MGCVYSRDCIGQICSTRDARAKEPRRQNAGSGNAELSVFNDEQAEIRHGFNRLELNQDPECGINRLSRVSAQFLPPDGSRTVKVPSYNYELRYSFLSQRGYYPDALDKANQDSFAIHTPFGTSQNDHFFGVFDGHGEFGAQCSQFVKRKLCENLLRHENFPVDAVEACNAAFLRTNAQLHAENIDDSMSGTTAITILVRGRTIYVANCGDSRAVLAEKRDGDTVAIDLSVDQTPFRGDEFERVRLCGARVLTLDQIEGLKNPDFPCWGTEEGDDGDPPRLWVPNGMYPGTAFTRSIGDSIAETIGVVANPEIVAVELSPNHPFFVLASDGVFEFLSSQTVVDMVAKFQDPRDACAELVAESYRLWLQYETRTDDITVIVVHINGLINTGMEQSAGPTAVLRPRVPQVVQMTGSESPSTVSWSSRNQRVRHDLSRARIRAIESSLEDGRVWVPPSPAHRKTWEEEAHIERALHDHFLFRKLSDSQCHVLLDCMQRVEVMPGDVIVKQGGEGDCFYVVGNGEFEVLATEEEKNGAVPRVLQQYTAEKLSSFGELALMYNKPLQASVRAVTHGTLWALRREDFRGILMSEFSNLASLKLLRTVDLLSRLTILQLSHVVDSLSEVTFSDGQIIVDKSEALAALHVIQSGRIKITFSVELLENPHINSLKSTEQNEDAKKCSNMELSIEKQEGSYFGEWALLGESVGSLTAVAVGDVVCSLLTKEKFDLVIGPLSKPSQDDLMAKSTVGIFKELPDNIDDTSFPVKVSLSDLEWKTCVISSDCSEIGLVHLRGQEKLLSLKRFSKQRVKRLGRDAQVLKEKNLMKSISPLSFVPQVLCTCANQTHAGLLLNTCLACPLASILHSPLDEAAAQFCAAVVVTALEELHEMGVLYRSVSSDTLVLDREGYLQLVDFRFGKKSFGERTFTICGMADFLAPEVVQGKGHGFPADWWAVGVLIYFMLQCELPFGSWRENEIDTYVKIARGQMKFPRTLSANAIDLITKLLEVDESARLGTQGPESIKNHPWFRSVHWDAIRDRSTPVPSQISARLRQHMESRAEDCALPTASPPRDIDDLNTPEWVDEW